MRRNCWLPGVLAGVLWLAGVIETPRGAAADGEFVQPDAALSFEREVRPIFRKHCFDCHGAGSEAPEGGLDLRLRRRIVGGGASGAAIQPGQPDHSLLLQRVRGGEMPPGDAKLTPQELDLLARWIQAGAPTLRGEPEQLEPGVEPSLEERSFWSFQPITRPALPAVSDAERVRTPLDALLLARLQEQGLTFAPDADGRTLLRRLKWDLLGLPPTPEELEAFTAAGDTAGEYEAWVERWLASPQYGERWGRHWLDVAGYADSDGYTTADSTRPYAYKYRDYVIRSWNANKPFDQFLIEQLAGDELVPSPYQNLTPEQIEPLVATGFLRMAADGTGSGAPDLALASNQVVADTLKIVSGALLGLSVQCAQCHDHRYDPISQTDYFRLRAVFEPAFNWQQWRTPAQRLVSLYTDADRARAAEVEAEAQVVAAEKQTKLEAYLTAALEAELAKFDEPLREPLRAAYRAPADQRTEEQKKLLAENPSVNISAGTLYQYNAAAAEELKKIDERIAQIRSKKPVEDFIQVLTEIPGQLPATQRFHRGDHRQPKEAVAPGGLTIAAPPGERLQIADDNPDLPTSGRRLAYARWLTSGRHPLVARVLVNRIWLHHFGRGLVGTPADFGVLGEPPTHPELLDWLADEFVRSGWNLKHLQRLIVSSSVFRQSSRATSAAAAADPENRLYSRMPVRRLDAELLRDGMLVVSGSLQPQLYGPATPMKQDFTGQVVTDGEDIRRSIYLQTRRSQPHAFLTTFDAPVMETNCERRTVSTAATQSLMLMNSDFILAQAGRFAARVAREAPLESPLALGGELTALLRDPASDWSYGSGMVDEGSGRVAQFKPLPHWTGSAWQGGSVLPDPDFGWVLLHEMGGHAGSDLQHATIRRWTAPRDGTVAIGGQLHHASENGDGVRGRIVSSRHGILGDWVAQHGGQEASVAEFTVAAGDTVDFVIDCRSSVTSDSFSWTADVRWRGAAGAVETWNTRETFRGPPAATPPLASQVAYAWQLAFGRLPTTGELEDSSAFLAEQIRLLRSLPAESRKGEPVSQAMINLCQALLSSNEFLYVD